MLQQVFDWFSGLICWSGFNLDRFSRRCTAHVDETHGPFEPRLMAPPAGNELTPS
ncbi:MAG TPA: hypothetical protein VJW93_06460 [Candidatus Acidoferrales bacterium]|nr:hypothetical protein [Candidatus Acidoferrales bacterium]